MDSQAQIIGVFEDGNDGSSEPLPAQGGVSSQKEYVWARGR